MAIDYGALAKAGGIPKPEPRKRVKARKKRRESALVKEVRRMVSERDGHCRLHDKGFGLCFGVSTWAHLEDHRRFRTRGMEPEQRHTTTDTVMLCAKHHFAYDLHGITVEYTTDAGADGPLIWIQQSYMYGEPKR